MEGKAAAKLYAAARLGNGIPSRNWKFVTVIECEFDVNVIAHEVLEGKAKGNPPRSGMQAAGRRPDLEMEFRHGIGNSSP
jgi:hypothetical protein